MLPCAYECGRGSSKRVFCSRHLMQTQALWRDQKKNVRKHHFPSVGISYFFFSDLLFCTTYSDQRIWNTMQKGWHLFLLTHQESLLSKVRMVYHFSLPVQSMYFTPLQGNKALSNIWINAQLHSKKMWHSMYKSN